MKELQPCETRPQIFSSAIDVGPKNNEEHVGSTSHQCSAAQQENMSARERMEGFT